MQSVYSYIVYKVVIATGIYYLVHVCIKQSSLHPHYTSNVISNDRNRGICTIDTGSFPKPIIATCIPFFVWLTHTAPFWYSNAVVKVD